LAVPVRGIRTGGPYDRVGLGLGGPQLQQVGVHRAIGELLFATGVPPARADPHPVRPIGKVKRVAGLAGPRDPRRFRSRRHLDRDLDDILPLGGIERGRVLMKLDPYRRATGVPGEVDVDPLLGRRPDQAVHLTGEDPGEVPEEALIVVVPDQLELPEVGHDRFVQQDTHHGPSLPIGRRSGHPASRTPVKTATTRSAAAYAKGHPLNIYCGQSWARAQVRSSRGKTVSRRTMSIAAATGIAMSAPSSPNAA